jgi:hypothetical protein
MLYLFYIEKRPVCSSSFFALGSEVIALSFPAFSECFHLQRESGMRGPRRAGQGRNSLLGIGDSTTHLFLANPPVLLVVITVVHFQLLLCKIGLRQGMFGCQSSYL